MKNRAVVDILVKRCGLDPNKPVLVGVSGGPDSLYLLHHLKNSGFNTIAAHLDHSLRLTSADDAHKVAEICSLWQIPLVSRRMNVAQFAQKQGIAIEEAARVRRYQYLFEEAAMCNAQAVLVGHNADDQVETVLMHLIRGSGMSGLTGMRMVLLPNPWNETIPLIRPLLLTWRAEIDDYCRSHELHPILDETNTDQKYFRNRIRHHLIPVLESYNPLIKEGLQKTVNVIATEDDFLMREVDAEWQNIVKRQSSQFIGLGRDEAVHLHPAVLRRVIRKAINSLNQSLRDIDFDVVERAVQFCKQPNWKNHLDLISGLEIFTFFHDEFVIAVKESVLIDLCPQVTLFKQAGIPVPGKILIDESWEIEINNCEKMVKTDDPYICYLDFGLLNGKLEIRTFNPGDKFIPFGMGGKSLKVGDFWTNEGLPARARNKWPLVWYGDQIVWLPGFRIADPFRVTGQTKNIVRMALIKK